MVKLGKGKINNRNITAILFLKKIETKLNLVKKWHFKSIVHNDRFNCLQRLFNISRKSFNEGNKPKK